MTSSQTAFVFDDGEWEALIARGEKPGNTRSGGQLSPTAGPVCVTGATGFIALHLVEQLLEKSYTVVGTVRSSSDHNKMAPLRRLQQKYGEEKLRIIEGVDCLKSDTFDAAVANCAGVFHTASPFHFNSNNPMADLVAPAVTGTTACLSACRKAGTVQRVIVTSSMACMFNFGKYPWDYTYTSGDWNIVSRPDKDGQLDAPIPQNGYRYSKMAAEKAAWDFASEEGCPFDVACICPPQVIGRNYNAPRAVADLNTSSATILKILMGQQAPNPNSMGFVDVEDVARAHIAAYEHPEAGGRRFLCAADALSWTELAVTLKELCPDYPIITTPPETGVGLKLTLDTSALNSLSGFTFTPLRETLKKQCESLISKEFAKL